MSDLLSILNELEKDDGEEIDVLKDFGVSDRYSSASSTTPQANVGIEEVLGLASADSFDIDIEDSSTVRGGAAPNGVSNLPSQEQEDVSRMDWGQYIIRLKDTFVKAKPLYEVQAFASVMAPKDWLDYVIRMMPKDVKVQGAINYKHYFQDLGPINKQNYLPKQKVREVTEVTDAEFKDIS